jgi:hypothetical protein
MFPIGIVSLHAPADECGFAVGAAGAEDHHFRLFTCEHDGGLAPVDLHFACRWMIDRAKDFRCLALKLIDQRTDRAT